MKSLRPPSDEMVQEFNRIDSRKLDFRKLCNKFEDQQSLNMQRSECRKQNKKVTFDLIQQSPYKIAADNMSIGSFNHSDVGEIANMLDEANRGRMLK